MHRTECNWLPGARRWSRIDHVTIVIAVITFCRQLRALAICLRCRGIDMARRPRRPVIVETPDGSGGLVERLTAPADRTGETLLGFRREVTIRRDVVSPRVRLGVTTENGLCVTAESTTWT
jgi:hypothetical protein